METKGILRVVLLIASSLMMLGSICDKKGGNPAVTEYKFAGPDLVVKGATGYDYPGSPEIPVKFMGEIYMYTTIENAVLLENVGTEELYFNKPPEIESLYRGGDTVKITTNDEKFGFSWGSGYGAGGPYCGNYTWGGLVPGASCSLLLKFHPKVSGEQWAIIYLDTNDVDQKPNQIKLYGIGLFVETAKEAEPAPLPSDTGSGRGRGN